MCAVIMRNRGSVENKPRTRRKKKHSVQDERSSLRSVITHCAEPLKEITHIFNQIREKPVSKDSVKRSLFRNKYHRRVVRKNIHIREVNSDSLHSKHSKPIQITPSTNRQDN